MGTQCSQVFRRRVPFVLRKPVVRVYPVPLDHLPVALDLGDDRSRRNRNRQRVSVNERLLFDQHIQLHGVQKQVIGGDFQLAQGFGHGLAAGLIDVPGVNAARIGLRDRPGQRVLANPESQHFAALRGQLLRIIKPDNPPPGIEDNRRGDDWAKERTSAHFVQAGNSLPAAFARFALESGRALLPHRGGF